MRPSIDSSPTDRRLLLVVVPFVFAILAWAGWLIPQRPTSGIQSLAADGTIQALEPAGPARDLLREGDVIVSVDGIPFAQLRRLESGRRVGDPLPFVVARDGRHTDVVVTLAPIPRARLFGGIAPWLLALVFAIAGTVAYVAAPATSSARLFFLTSHVSATALAFAIIGITRHPWADGLFYILMWFTTPLLVHLHLTFLEARIRPTRRLLLKLLYALSAVGSLPFLVWSAPALDAMPWRDALYSAARLYVAAGVVLAVGLLVTASRGAASPATRRQVRPVLFTGALVLLLAVSLSILPDGLGFDPILPYRFAFVLLLALPVSYAYAIARGPAGPPQAGVEAVPARGPGNWKGEIRRSDDFDDEMSNAWLKPLEP